MICCECWKHVAYAPDDKEYFELPVHRGNLSGGCRWNQGHDEAVTLDLPVFLLSLPQSAARRRAIEPQIRAHVNNISLVQPYDGRRRRQLADQACTRPHILHRSILHCMRHTRYAEAQSQYIRKKIS